MLVRRMNEADVRRVAEIEAKNFTQPWSENAFLEALKSPDNILIVALEEEIIEGYICMYVSIDEGEITNVAVEKNMRGRNIATSMMQMAFEEAGQANVQRVVLEVRVSNKPAISLYKKLGFKELGVRKGFYDLPKEDAYIMEYIIEKVGK